MPRKYTPEERIAAFWSRVDKSGGDDACWIWTGSKLKQGYGHMSWGGKIQRSHRIVYALTFGEIPEELLVLHSCDNPPCVNPRHLFLGTHKDNADDRERKGRHNPAFGDRNGTHLHPERVARGTRHNSQLHPERVARGTRIGTAKLTEANVVNIRQLYAEGKISMHALARQFSVTYPNIRSILRRKTWNWL